MHIKTLLITTAMFGSLTAMTACARTPDATAATPAVAAPSASPVTAAEASAAAAPQPPAPSTAAADATAPSMIVHKSESCGCCGLWVDHMRAAGFAVEVRNADNLNPVKERLGVPYGKGSCHTAEVGGYFIEGHVPAADVRRLLADKPDAKGLVLPGMPMGSPGM
ncbi:MAG: DUF411 domain-containing protein, partial [Pseudomonadota bacterium]